MLTNELTDETQTAPTKTTVWISALIPRVGGDVYEGVRLQASLSEEDCYRDLADWLDHDFESVQATIDLLNASEEIQLWKAEEQTVYAV